MLQSDADPTIFGQTMLTADELFLNGKLLPLHIPPQILHQEMDDATPNAAAEPEPKPETKIETTETIQIVNLEDAKSSAEFGSNKVPVSPRSPKLSHRWKEIFKIGKLQVSTSREDEHQETKKGAKKESYKSGFALKQPLSPRSIWPFSRSSSAGDAKVNSAYCSLASSRSNSAGDSNYKPKASSAPCSRSNSGGDSKLKARNASSSKIHTDFNTKPVRMFSNSITSSLSSNSVASEPVDFSVASTQQETCPLPSSGIPPVSTTEESKKSLESMSKLGVVSDVGSPERTNPWSAKKKNGRTKSKEKRSPNKTSTDGVQGSISTRNKGCASPGRTLRTRSPSGNYGRGSPVRIIGRSGTINGSPGRVGSGKFMIKNLERCTANSNKSVKSQDSVWPGRQKEVLNTTDRGGSYSNGVRVLNVPVCMTHPRLGRASNNRLFNFRSLFARKEKECSLVN
ncbi:hypothetical protein SUGI_0737110 [Cryptomeria japonica]|nr:hypothetical protein SUGI_0737110 [Cryptomeria japonica]